MLDRKRAHWLRAASIPFCGVVVFLGSWVLMDILIPPAGGTIVGALTREERGHYAIGAGSALHAVAALLLAALADIVVMAIVHAVENRRKDRE